MKKLILFLLMIPISVWAADQDEICRRNTLVMAVLRTDAETTALARNVSTDGMYKNKHWKVNVGYDVFANMRPELGSDGVRDIYGSATCNGKDVMSSPDGKSNNYRAASFGDTNTFLKASVKDVGANCWCKMDWPVTSWWTYFKKYDAVGDRTAKQVCAEECAKYCAEKFTSNGELGTNTNSDKVVYGRDALYYTIW